MMRRRFRFTIGRGMGAIVAAGFLMGSLRSPSPTMMAVVVASASFLLLAATVAALGAGRPAFWRGYAVFGWGQLILARIFNDPSVPGENRLSSEVSRLLFEVMTPASSFGLLTYPNFHQIWISWVGVALGVMGGLLALWFAEDETGYTTHDEGATTE